MGASVNRKNWDRIVTLEILRGLRHLGGQASKSDLLTYFRTQSAPITDEMLDTTLTSKKSGKPYKPFDFTFNYNLKYLELADYITRPRRAYFQLTTIGENCELSENLSQDVLTKANQTLDKQKMEDVVSHEELPEDEPAVDWSEELLDYLKAFSPSKFEQFCRQLVHQMGVSLDETVGIQISNDGGLDGFGYITSQDDFRTNRVAIQAKRWQGTIQSPEIDKFRGAMDKFNAEYGIFITTSTFTRGAIKASRQGSRVITLIDGAKIAELVAKYQLHVKPVTTYLIGDFYKRKGQ